MKEAGWGWGGPKPMGRRLLQTPFQNLSLQKVLGGHVVYPPHDGHAQNIENPTIVNPPRKGARDAVIVNNTRLSLSEQV